MHIGLGVDQLSVDANPIAQPPDAAFEHISDTELAADLLGVNAFALIGERSVSRDHQHPGDARQIGRQILGDSVCEILLLRIIAEIGKRQHDDRQPRRNWLRNRRSRRTWSQWVSKGFRAQRIDPHWASDVLDAPLAQVLESEGQLVTDLVAHHSRDADLAGLCQSFQASCDVDAVAKDIVILNDDVAEIDPDPKPDAAVLGCAGFAVDHCPLQFHGTAHRVDDAREFRQHAIAGILDDAAGMLADLWVDELAAMRLEALMGAFLVRAHQPRVARHIEGEDRGELAGHGHSSGNPAQRRPTSSVFSRSA